MQIDADKVMKDLMETGKYDFNDLVKLSSVLWAFQAWKNAAKENREYLYEDAQRLYGLHDIEIV